LSSDATFSDVLFPSDDSNMYRSTLLGGGFVETNQGCQDFNECEADNFCDTGKCVNRLGGYDCESDLDISDKTNTEIFSLNTEEDKIQVETSNQRCNHFDFLTSKSLASNCYSANPASKEQCFQRCAENYRNNGCPAHSAPCKYALWTTEPSRTYCLWASACRFNETIVKNNKVLSWDDYPVITAGPIENGYKLEKFLVNEPIGGPDLNYLSRYIYKTTRWIF